MEKQKYKQTEIGEIPEDWDVLKVEDIADVLSGKRIPKGRTLTKQLTPYPYITVSDLENCSVDLDNIRYVPIDVYPLIEKYRIFTEDIYISVAGTLGLVGTIPIQLNGANLTENANRLTNIKCNRNYLLKVFSTPFIQRKIDEVKTHGAQPKLALTRIRTFLIPLPRTKEEQTAIATVLSDTDELITSLDKLIAKKKAMKQGAMQELLTGKKRLPGFSGEWSVAEIDSRIDLLTGFPFPSNRYTITGTRLLRGSNVKRKVIDWSEDLTQFWADVDSRLKPYLLKEGDIVVAMDGSLVGKSFAQINNQDLPSLLLQRVARIRSSEIDINFLKEFICSDYFTKHCDSVKTSSAIPHISPLDIRQFKISIPHDKLEQTAIATVLSDMDSELESLEKKRDKYLLIKQGMMQQLLTGKIRLI